MRKFLIFVSLLALTGVACSSDKDGTTASPSPSVAADVTIEMLTTPNLVFEPVAATAKVGDTVLWKNVQAAPHTVTSKTSEWPDSGTISQGGTFSHTFDKAGTFDYSCTIHPGMDGKITVA